MSTMRSGFFSCYFNIPRSIPSDPVTEPIRRRDLEYSGTRNIGKYSVNGILSVSMCRPQNRSSPCYHHLSDIAGVEDYSDAVPHFFGHLMSVANNRHAMCAVGMPENVLLAPPKSHIVIYFPPIYKSMRESVVIRQDPLVPPA
jgi:hypothetical protein